MRTYPLLLVGSASLLLAVAHAHAGGLPVCSAKHKRPANLYGSVLSEGLKPVVAAKTDAAPATKTTDAPAAAAAPSPAAAAKPTQVSRAELRASFAPCRGGRS